MIKIERAMLLMKKMATSTSNPMPPRITKNDITVLHMVDDRLTYEEMAFEMGISAKSGVFRRIEKLISMGLVEKDPLKSRSRRLTDNGRRILSGEPATSGSPTSE